MPPRCSVAERAYAKQYRINHLTKILEDGKLYRKAHREEFRKRAVNYRRELKTEILKHYGPNEQLQCSWKLCNVIDIDMLTLDHINDNGAEHRRQLGNRGGTGTYLAIKKSGFPPGFQTLCWNHQWKKRLGCSTTRPRRVRNSQSM